jgi:hypothetical protein
MPLFEYILVALLGSGSAPSAPPTVTLGADAIDQPNGGVLLAGQTGPLKDGPSRVKLSARKKSHHKPIKRKNHGHIKGGAQGHIKANSQQIKLKAQ